MTNYIDHPNESKLLRLTGKITSYQQERLRASFVFTESDQNRMGAIAIASALAGLPGQAAIMSNHASSMEEEADYVQFTLDDKQIQGWLWRSPFKEGDEVVAAVEKWGDRYELYGLMRPEDKVIALYPHCSRGRMRHIRTVMKWSGIMVLMFVLFLLFFPLMGGYFKFWEFWIHMFTGEPAVWFIFFGTIVAIMASGARLGRKWMPFVRLAEKVFRVLELPSPSNVDLVKSSKLQTTENDPPECGVMYFKY